MRRKPNTLIPIELSILAVAARLRSQGIAEFYGFQIAGEVGNAHYLASRGTLYRALKRLQERGLLSSRWENTIEIAEQNRPRRRFYKLTPVFIEGLPLK